MVAADKDRLLTIDDRSVETAYSFPQGSSSVRLYLSWSLGQAFGVGLSGSQSFSCKFQSDNVLGGGTPYVRQGFNVRAFAKALKRWSPTCR